MRLLITFLAVVLFINTKAQTDFSNYNRDEVINLVTNPKLNTFYPKLFQRFNDFDSTLTLQDYQLIYYGFATRNNYFGYTDVKSKEINEAIMNKEFEMAAQLADSVLADAPVNLKANLFKAVSLYLLDSLNLPHDKYMTRYYMLANVILQSGDGLSCETAFKVLYVSDEYEIIYSQFNIEGVNSQHLVTPCDLLKIIPNENFNSEEIYFDVSEPFKSMESKFMKKEDKKKQKNKKD